MSVSVSDKTFYLKTENTLYQMKVDVHGALRHLWYGARSEQDFDYMLDYPDVGFSGNIYEAGKVRNYSKDTLPREYAAHGVGDFRISAVDIIHPCGAQALDLRYESYRVVPGKYSIPDLPAVYASNEEADTLEITLKDVSGQIRVVLKYGILEKYDIITRSAVICNDGDETVTLSKAHSVCLDIPYEKWELIHFHGRHAMERQPERSELIHGIMEISSKRGISSHHQNPAIILGEKGCSETAGRCIGAMLMYSGCFQIQVECDQMNQTRMVMGIHPELFSWELKKGGRFYTPEAVLCCSETGIEHMSHCFHRLIREHVMRGVYQNKPSPILLNNWEATYYQFDEERILSIAKEAAALGIELFVLDDGWFGRRDNDESSLGDWFEDRRKLPGGLKALAEKINDMGLSFGLWIEPEMVSEDSELFRAHPDWAIRIPGRDPMRGRYQLVLDMSKDDVREYLFDMLGRILRQVNISYIKWDFNRSVSDWHTDMLPPSRQSELPHRFVLGSYDLMERLTGAFPHILFEGCCGGGGRFDAGMLYYFPQIWCSDDTDAYERVRIQYGTSFFYPIVSMGSHVSASPNHQTGRVASIRARGVVAMAGSFGYEIDPRELTDEEREDVREQIATFREMRDLIHEGSYYRLSNPAEDKYGAWSYVSEDKSRVLLHGMIFRTEPNMLRYPVRLRGLDPGRPYRLRDTGDEFYGDALMAAGILLPRSWGDCVPVQMYFEAI